ncbi:MAG: hypothetical protein ACYC5A_04610 [Thermoleophilia bacterium]
MNRLRSYLSKRSVAFTAMIGFGLAVGLVFPLLVDPLVVGLPEAKLLFRVISMLAGIIIAAFCFNMGLMALTWQNRELENRSKELHEARNELSALYASTRSRLPTMSLSMSSGDARGPRTTRPSWRASSASSRKRNQHRVAPAPTAMHPVSQTTLYEQEPHPDRAFMPVSPAPASAPRTGRRRSPGS